jgi:hypothetical protein
MRVPPNTLVIISTSHDCQNMFFILYICAKGIDLASVSRIIRIDFRTVLTVLYFLFVNILIYVKNVLLYTSL